MVNAQVLANAAHLVRVFTHSRFERRKGDGLAEDGVHVKESSMRQYWWSVRGALMLLVKGMDQ